MNSLHQKGFFLSDHFWLFLSVFLFNRKVFFKASSPSLTAILRTWRWTWTPDVPFWIIWSSSRNVPQVNMHRRTSNKFKLVKNRIHAAVSLTGCFCTLATGELMTMAKWMREFVAKHPEYKQDSVISDKINYDLIQQCDRISKGEEACPELIGTPGNKVKWGTLPKPSSFKKKKVRMQTETKSKVHNKMVQM